MSDGVGTSSTFQNNSPRNKSFNCSLLFMFSYIRNVILSEQFPSSKDKHRIYVVLKQFKNIKKKKNRRRKHKCNANYKCIC